MLINFLFTFIWVSGGLAIHHTLPTWLFVLYGIMSAVSFFAWTLVRGGSLTSVQEEQQLRR
jgi:hypothetical protein